MPTGLKGFRSTHVTAQDLFYFVVSYQNSFATSLPKGKPGTSFVSTEVH
jgi:hypothetical protein